MAERPDLLNSQRARPFVLPQAGLHASALLAEIEQDAFRGNYNQRSFSFTHSLCGRPELGFQSILEAVRRHPLPASRTYWCNGDVRVQDTWDAGRRPRYSLEDTLADIASNNSLVILKGVEQDERFGPLVRECMDSVMNMVGEPMRSDVTIGRGTLLVASPRRLTSYHIDADVNFLFQVAGDKRIDVYDQHDRKILPHEELERFYQGDANGAVFKPERQSDGTSYRLTGGDGVHIPCMAPHWAQTLDEPSIALSINFDLRSIERLRRLYRLNGGLRRRGMEPTPPGVSPWRDAVKSAAVAGLRIVRMVRR